MATRHPSPTRPSDGDNPFVPIESQRQRLVRAVWCLAVLLALAALAIVLVAEI
jgi:hypothetical protein